MKYVYAFREGNRDQKYLLGGKGANLAEMTSLGLPVPPGFTISTDACKAYMAAGDKLPDGLMGAVGAGGARSETELATEDLAAVVETFKGIVKEETGEAFPQNPDDQLASAIEAVFRSWNGRRARDYRRMEKIPDDLGTAVNVQTMVFGNKGDDSGTGVAFTRNPSTGERAPYGDFLANAQGEDVVAGIRITEPLDAMANHFA